MWRYHRSREARYPAQACRASRCACVHPRITDGGHHLRYAEIRSTMHAGASWQIPCCRQGQYELRGISPGGQYWIGDGHQPPKGIPSVTSASRRSAGRREFDLLGAWRYEVNGIRRPLLAPHLVGDFANDLAVFHLKKVSQAHGKLGPNRIGNVGHFVAYHGNVAYLIVEHELLGREPAQRHHVTIGDSSEDRAISFQDLVLIIHHDAARRRLPTDRVPIKSDCFLDMLWCLIMEMRFDHFQVARDDLFMRQGAIGQGGVYLDRPFHCSFNASHLMLPAFPSLAMRAVDDLVGDAAEPFDPRGQRSAWLHVDAGIAADPDAVRRPCHDYIARPQRDVTRRKGDELRNAEHHLRRGAGLHDLPVHDGLKLQIRNGNGVRRYDEGTDGTTLVHILSQRPLTAAQRDGLELRRPTTDIVSDRVSEYACCSGLFIDINGRGAHDGGQLDLPVETVWFSGRHRYVRSIDNELGCPSREQVREGRCREVCFSSMLDVVDGSANDLRIARHRWRERQVGERDFPLFQSRCPLLPARQVVIERIDGSKRRDLVADHHAHHAVLRIAPTGFDVANKTHANGLPAYFAVGKARSTLVAFVSGQRAETVFVRV